MGQGGGGPVPGASALMDCMALWQRHQSLGNMCCTVLWGAVGEIGLRLALYGSRDVFAQFDLGQKLLSPSDTQFIERQFLTCQDVQEFMCFGYLDQTWQAQLNGTSAVGGLAGRK